MDINIRFIELKDAEVTLAIYAPYIQNTTVSFEYEVPTLEDWHTRIKEYGAEYPWLVCEYENRIIGYAYGSKHRARTAYSWCSEVSIYMLEEFHGLGVAKMLYETLFGIMRLQGYINAYAGIALPNSKSENFHRKSGFSEIGIYKKIGYKFGAWHDVLWLQLHLAPHPGDAVFPKKIQAVKDEEQLAIILNMAKLKFKTNVKCSR